MSASAPNFTTATLKNVSVVLNQPSTANLTLEVGTATTILNFSEAAVIVTTTSQVENTLGASASEDLPTPAPASACSTSPC